MESIEAEALRRNDRYLRKFVEALDLCPFAKRCREMGRLVRRVVPGAAPLARALDELASVSKLPEERCEVALLIFPEFDAGVGAFQEMCAQVRMRSGLFHCVAFHPELPMDLSDPHRAVPFLRRSPDPTLQLVRIATLDRVRAQKPGGSVFIDVSRLSPDQLRDLEAPISLSEQIARANLRTLQQHDPDELARLLASWRAPT